MGRLGVGVGVGILIRSPSTPSAWDLQLLPHEAERCRSLDCRCKEKTLKPVTVVLNLLLLEKATKTRGKVD